METQNENGSLVDKITNWTRTSVTLKLLVITILVLLLLIPKFMITDLIYERQSTRQQVISSVTEDWGRTQVVCGPILTVPYYKYYETVNEKGEKQISKAKNNAYFLPENLKINGKINPEPKHRGIYDLVVYKSDLNITGSYGDLNFTDLGIDEEDVIWNEAFITNGVSDMRGIKNDITFKYGDEKFKVSPGTKTELLESGFTINMPQASKELLANKDFSYKLSLNGSSSLGLVPLGKVSSYKLISSWASPSFTGNFLPNNDTVSEKGFEADWKVLDLNRGFAQSWTNSESKVSRDIYSAASFTNLLLPIDDYQKTMRTAKYASFNIILTFLMFFLVEVIKKQRVHAFQYVLIGLALSIFYVLLLAFSEHVGFNVSYIASAIAITLMILLYSFTIFKKRAMSLLLGVLLALTYTYFFVVLQFKDYALVMGSIGLTIILGAIMYFTRNINWYKTSENKPEA